MASNDPLKFGINFRGTLLALVAHLAKHPEVSIDWSGLVEVSRTELDSLSPENQVLGCQPSENVYGVRPILAGEYYPKRSAGGHIHVGGLPINLWQNYSETEHRAQLIPLFDILVGNSCVLLDRDEGQIERRRNYGRAGEFRKQPHGVEYRTLSSFWTRHYALLDFVLGMTNLAVSIAQMTASGSPIEDGLKDVVDIDNFILAIDTNDFSLARRNFESIVPFLRKELPETGFPLNPKNIDHFLGFGEAVKEKGLTHYFPETPEVAWAQREYTGFSDLLKKFF
jgi:hypothetical protein